MQIMFLSHMILSKNCRYEFSFFVITSKTIFIVLLSSSIAPTGLLNGSKML